MSEIYITIFDYSNEVCAFRWLLIKGESTINASIDIEFAFFCYDEQNKITIYIVYKQKCSSHWLLYMVISEAVCNEHWLFIFIFRLIVHENHCKLKWFCMICNKTIILWVCPLIKGRNNIYIRLSAKTNIAIIYFEFISIYTLPIIIVHFLAVYC